MTEIRELTLTPPPGEWIAVQLLEAADPDGPWVSIQGTPVQDDGPVTVRFRPRITHGLYKPLWVPEGGSHGMQEGPVVTADSTPNGTFTYNRGGR